MYLYVSVTRYHTQNIRKPPVEPWVYNILWQHFKAWRGLQRTFILRKMSCCQQLLFFDRRGRNEDIRSNVEAASKMAPWNNTMRCDGSSKANQPQVKTLSQEHDECDQWLMSLVCCFIAVWCRSQVSQNFLFVRCEQKLSGSVEALKVKN